ncbi:MAG: hypothetical protein GC181_13405 [Bacteroidetes bacterium]|nr:hypothetical protein [Bacteroidota bacterium]
MAWLLPFMCVACHRDQFVTSPQFEKLHFENLENVLADFQKFDSLKFIELNGSGNYDTILYHLNQVNNDTLIIHPTDPEHLLSYDEIHRERKQFQFMNSSGTKSFDITLLGAPDKKQMYLILQVDQQTFATRLGDGFGSSQNYDSCVPQHAQYGQTFINLWTIYQTTAVNHFSEWIQFNVTDTAKIAYYNPDQGFVIFGDASKSLALLNH